MMLINSSFNLFQKFPQGLVWQQGSGLFSRWRERFLVLTKVLKTSDSNFYGELSNRISIFWKGLHPVSQEVIKQLLRVRHAAFHAQSCPRLRGSAKSFWRGIHIICKRCCTGQFLLTRGRPKKMVQIIFFYNSS